MKVVIAGGLISIFGLLIGRVCAQNGSGVEDHGRDGGRLNCRSICGYGEVGIYSPIPSASLYFQSDASTGLRAFLRRTGVQLRRAVGQRRSDLRAER